jgi:hypothetical protein
MEWVLGTLSMRGTSQVIRIPHDFAAIEIIGCGSDEDSTPRFQSLLGIDGMLQSPLSGLFE